MQINLLILFEYLKKKHFSTYPNHYSLFPQLLYVNFMENSKIFPRKSRMILNFYIFISLKEKMLHSKIN